MAALFTAADIPAIAEKIGATLVEGMLQLNRDGLPLSYLASVIAELGDDLERTYGAIYSKEDLDELQRHLLMVTTEKLAAAFGVAAPGSESVQ